MTERVVRNLEPRTRLIETWSVVDTTSYLHPSSWGSGEAACRKYQAKHGGELQVIRIWETTIGQVVAVEPTTHEAAPVAETRLL